MCFFTASTDLSISWPVSAQYSISLSQGGGWVGVEAKREERRVVAAVAKSRQKEGTKRPHSTVSEQVPVFVASTKAPTHHVVAR